MKSKKSSLPQKAAPTGISRGGQAYYTIPMVEKIVGIPRQTIYYQIAHNINNIREHLYVDRGKLPIRVGDVLIERKPGSSVRYLLDAEFVASLLLAKDEPKEEDIQEFRSLYYKLYDAIEQQLESMGKSKATEENLLGNMPEIDAFLGEMILAFTTKEVKPKDKDRIKRAVRTHYFTSQRILDICLDGMKNFSKSIRRERR